VYPTPDASPENVADDIEFMFCKGGDLEPMASPSYIMNDPYPVVIKVEPDTDSQMSESSCYSASKCFLNKNYDREDPSLASLGRPKGPSDLPDLLPTIDPKLETYDIMETMGNNVFTNNYQSWPIPTTSNHALASPNLEYLCAQEDTSGPSARTSSPDDIGGPPPDEIFEMLDELWVGEDLF